MDAGEKTDTDRAGPGRRLDWRPADTAGTGQWSPADDPARDLDAGTEPATRSPRRTGRWRGVRLALVLTLIGCVFFPAAWLIYPLVTGTIDAGKGAAEPSIAVFDYLTYGPMGGPWRADEVGFDHRICRENRKELRQQAEQLTAAAKRAEIPGQVALGAIEHRNVRTAENGDRATATVAVAWTYDNANLDRGITEWMSYRAPEQDWVFELVNTNGWRVCKVTAPDPCKGINCEPGKLPTPTPSVSASPTWNDDRVPYKCFPDAPYRDLQGCATPPPDWTPPPWPWYCHPDYGLRFQHHDCPKLD